jgi:histone H3/H4
LSKTKHKTTTNKKLERKKMERSSKTDQMIFAFSRKGGGDKKRKKSGNTKEPPQPEVKKPKRYRPGTVALREIRRYQKSVDNVIRKGPFRELCRSIVREASAKMIDELSGGLKKITRKKKEQKEQKEEKEQKGEGGGLVAGKPKEKDEVDHHLFMFRPNAFEAIQEAAENRIVQILEDAYLATTHAKRITLMPKDILLATRIRGIKIIEENTKKEGDKGTGSGGMNTATPN